MKKGILQLILHRKALVKVVLKGVWSVCFNEDMEREKEFG